MGVRRLRKCIALLLLCLLLWEICCGAQAGSGGTDQLQSRWQSFYNQQRGDFHYMV